MTLIDNHSIGNTIKEKRKKKKLTQKELAEAIGKAEISVRKYESGTIQIPNDVLQMIAEALDTTIVELLGWDDEITPIVNGMEGLNRILEHVYDSIKFVEYEDSGSYDVILIKDGKKTILEEVQYQSLYEFLCLNIPFFIDLFKSGLPNQNK